MRLHSFRVPAIVGAGLAVAVGASLLATPAAAAPSRLITEKQLAAIVLMIGVTNMFNRLNATTRQIAGAWG